MDESITVDKSLIGSQFLIYYRRHFIVEWTERGKIDKHFYCYKSSRDLPWEGAGDNRLNETSTEESEKKKGNNEIINFVCAATASSPSDREFEMNFVDFIN